jgi:hypothetical protein
MSEWRTTDSPRLRIPMEMREIEMGAEEGRRWEVQELRGGSMFIVSYRPEARDRRQASDAAIEHAVCVAVEESILTPPDKEPGETYDVEVTAEHLDAARRTD